MAKTVRQITLSVPVDEYEMFAEEAALAGITLTEWARRKIRAPSRPEPRVLDEAFRRMDESDALREGREAPAAVVAPRPVDPLVALGVPIKGAEPHSCAHHRALQRYDGGSPRVCSHTLQTGRPCYFPSAGARDCTYYHPANVG